MRLKASVQSHNMGIFVNEFVKRSSVGCQIKHNDARVRALLVVYDLRPLFALPVTVHLLRFSVI